MSEKKPETYVSTDIEANGPIPGSYSMWSLGAAAYNQDGVLISTFAANLEDLPGTTGDPDTMAWWAKQPEALAEARRDARPPEVAMGKFAVWLEQLPGDLVFAGYPAAYDFLFVYWYYWKFLGRKPPFSHSALDVKTLAMALLRCSYKRATKQNWPARWSEGLPAHDHVAVNDAVEQGAQLCRMLAELRSSAMFFASEPQYVGKMPPRGPDLPCVPKEAPVSEQNPRLQKLDEERAKLAGVLAWQPKPATDYALEEKVAKFDFLHKMAVEYLEHVRRHGCGSATMKQYLFEEGVKLLGPGAFDAINKMTS